MNKSYLITFLLSSLVIQSPAFAQSNGTVGQLLKKMSAEDRGNNVKFQKSGANLPQAQKFQRAQPRSQVNLEQIKPPESSNFLEGRYEGDSQAAALEAVLNKQIEKLYSLTQKHKGSPNRGELWLRLAELYVEKASIMEYRIQTAYDEALQAYNSKQTRRMPKLDLSPSREYFQKAVQLYQWFVRDFPKDDKVDQALFFLGFNSFELGDTDKGAQYYSTLTKRHPRSPYVAEAYFALGEYHFEREEWAKAYNSYLRILKQKDPRLYTFALYKSAWSLFRLGQAGKGLRFMEQLIKADPARSDTLEGRKNISQGRLTEQALRDIVIFYGYSGDPKKAVAFFKRVAPQTANTYLEKLGYFYSDKGNREAASEVFKSLIDSDPFAPKAFDYQYQIVSNYSYVSNSEIFRKELYWWLEYYGPTSKWYQQNSSDKKLTDNAINLMEQTLRNHVLQAHQAAQDSRAEFSQKRAQLGYELYFKHFEKNEKIGEMHFFYAELLYDMKSYTLAASHYLKCTELDPKGQYFEKSALNAVLALEKTLPTDQEMEQRVGDSKRPVPFSSDTEKFAKVATWFVGKFPTHEESDKIRFRVGRLHYQHNQFPQAREHFTKIVESPTSSKYSEFSANLILDSYNLEGDTAGLEKAAKQLLSISSLAGSKVGGEIRDVLEKATFKKAQDLEVAKKYKESAEEFERFERENGKSDLAITALFNAAVNYERAGESAKALDLYGRFLSQRDKKSEHLRPEAARLRAKLLQDRGDYEAAAKAFENAAAVIGKGDLVANMHFNAAVLYEGLGNKRDAIKNYELYYKLEKGDARYDSLFPLAELKTGLRDYKGAIQQYNEFIARKSQDREKVIEAHYNIAQAYEKMGEDGKARSWYRRLLEQQAQFAPNKKGVGASYAAKIKINDSIAKYNQLKSIRLPNNPAAQEKAAQQKIGLVTELNKSLAEIIAYDSPDEIIAALTILAQANEHMGQALITAPLPDGLNAEETKQYQDGVKGFAEPFFNKAKESYQLAVNRGWELETYNSWYRQALEAVGRSGKEGYYNGGEIATESELIQWTDI